MDMPYYVRLATRLTRSFDQTPSRAVGPARHISFLPREAVVSEWWRLLVRSGQVASAAVGWALPDRALRSRALDAPALESAGPFARPGEDALLVSHDGAWNWMQDPKAVFIAGERRRTYASWMTRDGRLMLGAVDFDTRATETFTLRARWDRDDHNNAALVALSDRRLAAFYSRHNGRGMFCRVASRPEDLSAWGDETLVTTERRITYPNPVRVDSEGLWYCFWRGPTWKPTFATSPDLRAWSAPRVLLCDAGREGFWVRPYLKVAGDGRGRIHFAFTNGHPRNEPFNSIYYMRYERGRFFSAAGATLGALDALPMRHADAELVYDARAGGARAWAWDLALDAAGHPTIAYTRLVADHDHRYHVARFDGSRWRDVELTRGGGWFPRTPRGMHEFEPHYSGGIALDPADPNIAYLSRPVGGVFELERWTSSDGGLAWTGRALTAGSAADNVRPVVPRGPDRPANHLLWMHGHYVHYTLYQTDIRALITP